MNSQYLGRYYSSKHSTWILLETKLTQLRFRWAQLTEIRTFRNIYEKVHSLHLFMT